MSNTYRKLRPKLKNSDYWKKFNPERLRDGTQQYASRYCRNHGGCPYCLGNRMYSTKKREPITE